MRAASASEARAVRILNEISEGYQGGRSWGISSPQADYDIRFVFANQLPWYLSIDISRKDTIAFQLGAQVPHIQLSHCELSVIEIERVISSFDFCGWDLKKAITLLRESNPTILDCLRSSHVILSPSIFRTEGLRLAREYLSLRTVANQLLAYASKHYTSYIAAIPPQSITLKKYFYVIHPLLTLSAIRHNRAVLPPLDFAELVSTARGLSAEMAAAFHSLLQLKLSQTLTLANCSTVLLAINAWIDEELKGAAEFIATLPAHSTLRVPFEPFDALFRHAILDDTPSVS